MDGNILQALLVQGGLGSTAAVFIWLYLQEKKDRKSSEQENRQLRDQHTEHLKQDIEDKIADRDTLSQAITLIKGIKDVK